MPDFLFSLLLLHQPENFTGVSWGQSEILLTHKAFHTSAPPSCWFPPHSLTVPVCFSRWFEKKLKSVNYFSWIFLLQSRYVFSKNKSIWALSLLWSKAMRTSQPVKMNAASGSAATGVLTGTLIAHSLSVAAGFFPLFHTRSWNSTSSGEPGLKLALPECLRPSWRGPENTLAKYSRTEGRTWGQWVLIDCQKVPFMTLMHDLWHRNCKINFECFYRLSSRDLGAS